uniref:Uncharacterized protein n=1 Tax=Anguilla anguilla TaxID=7936 RepID=A0A0E9RPV1_ANGAN
MLQRGEKMIEHSGVKDPSIMPCFSLMIVHQQEQHCISHVTPFYLLPLGPFVHTYAHSFAEF